jgi:hypothetical protein
VGRVDAGDRLSVGVVAVVVVVRRMTINVMQILWSYISITTTDITIITTIINMM